MEIRGFVNHSYTLISFAMSISKKNQLDFLQVLFSVCVDSYRNLKLKSIMV